MKSNKKKFYMILVSSFLLFVMLAALNYNSLENAKNSCVENNKTPEVEQDFLAINWTVSCK
ncbi:hypothetical protein [Ureibacillus aquaedulcis]|uniref:Secreted protein n=1 Tax=Ureibacillus aquaedulcis TaxID=3058421 RepID=A0ABT8GST1_9BACL|nr:hypothetical protein [Ureibacillus sp. BA0131]MDN4494455.1 hypothetical protein [Ureibacillus sp. BA0131]